MGQLTPSFLIDVETNMRFIAARDYNRLNLETWWRTVANEMPSQSKRERLIWLLDTAKIQYVGRLGEDVEFEDVLSNTTEYEAKAATGGFSLNRFQLEDHDSGGVKLVEQWTSTIAAYAAYWPQKQVAKAVRGGATAGNTSYDNQVFFSNAHPLNPFDTAVGTFSNIHTAGSGAGAVPIDDSVTLDVAFKNLQKVFTSVRSIKMLTGEDPRFLRPKALIVPPAMAARAQQLTNARFIAQGATGGAGAGDVEAIIRNWGIGQPIVADELGAAFSADGGSDTDYYVMLEQVGTGDLGALQYINREPFKIIYNGEMTDAQLARMNRLQWLTRGRNVVVYGHPYLLHKCRST